MVLTRVHQGTSRQGGANSKNFKNSGEGVNSSDLTDNFWRSLHNFV
jgi:hypothetical protein